jgi:hypothetical protein
LGAGAGRKQQFCDMRTQADDAQAGCGRGRDARPREPDEPDEPEHQTQIADASDAHVALNYNVNKRQMGSTLVSATQTA